MKLFRRRPAEPTAAEHAEAESQEIRAARQAERERWWQEQTETLAATVAALPDLGSVACIKCGSMDTRPTCARVALDDDGVLEEDDDAFLCSARPFALAMAVGCVNCGYSVWFERPLDVPGKPPTYHTGGIVPEGESCTVGREIISTDDGRIVCLRHLTTIHDDHLD